MGTYNGVETALSFGSPAGELAALRQGCGVFALAWRSLIAVTGKDRVRWLHNMVTNNVRDLAVNRGNYNFVLNAQGRILGDMCIFNRGESFLLETDTSQVETLVNAMKRFIIMDKVELTPAAGLTALGVCGPEAAKTLATVGVDISGMAAMETHELSVAGHSVTVISGPESKPGWCEIWLGLSTPDQPINGPDESSSHAQEIWAKLTGAGAQPVGTEALETWRILRGIPQYGQDIRNSDLPQETCQTAALNFTKGCYIGQEIVERIRSRGHVHRQFSGFEFPAGVPEPAKGEPDRKAMAEITSVARVPAAEGTKNIGLGYVRREVLAAGPEVDLNGLTIRVVELPFEI